MKMNEAQEGVLPEAAVSQHYTLPMRHLQNIPVKTLRRGTEFAGWGSLLMGAAMGFVRLWETTPIRVRGPVAEDTWATPVVSPLWFVVGALAFIAAVGGLLCHALKESPVSQQRRWFVGTCWVAPCAGLWVLFTALQIGGPWAWLGVALAGLPAVFLAAATAPDFHAANRAKDAQSMPEVVWHLREMLPEIAQHLRGPQPHVSETATGAELRQP